MNRQAYDQKNGFIQPKGEGRLRTQGTIGPLPSYSQVPGGGGAPPAAVSDPAAVANPAAVGALSRVPSGIPTANAAGHPESFGADRPAKRKFPGGPDVI